MREYQTGGRRMRRTKRGLLLLLAAALLWRSLFLDARAADIQYRVNVRVFVDGTDRGLFPAIEGFYEKNLYLSLQGVSYALAGTKRAFTAAVEKQRIRLVTGEEETVRPTVWDQEAQDNVVWITPARNELILDGVQRKYHSFITTRDGNYDAFLTPVSIAMLFDLKIDVANGRVDIYTDEPFSASIEELENSGYLQGVNALLVGDASSGEIYYQYDAEKAFPIASTTKLMTYFVFMDAVANGECSLEDTARISKRAEKLAAGSDGLIPMKEGNTASVRDLLYGMMLLSSNECALVAAEHAAGSEEAFVRRMNEKAQELGLENAQFYNCHGLPFYEEQFLPAKLQNHMTAEEMFRFSVSLLESYPQITEFTSAKSYYLESLGVNARNYNVLLYNMEQAVGLKTGTTNKAGACLVTCVEGEKDGEKHDLIVVLFGADGDENRGIVSEIAARYALDALGERDRQEDEKEPAENETLIPRDPEKVIRRLLDQ